jgi:hypothetical protein
MVPAYVLLSVNRSVDLDGGAHIVNQLIEGILWLLIAAGWIAAPILILWGLLVDRRKDAAQHG